MSVRRTRMPAGPAGASGASADYINLQNQQTSGTAGGTSTAVTWTTCVLNTEVADTGGFCSLSSNQFTLTAGTYELEAMQSLLQCSAGKLRIRNITDGTTVLSGLNSYGNNSFGTSANGVVVKGRFTIGASKALALQYWVEAGQATNGLGAAATSGEVEVYAIVELRKVA